MILKDKSLLRARVFGERRRMNPFDGITTADDKRVEKEALGILGVWFLRINSAERWRHEKL